MGDMVRKIQLTEYEILKELDKVAKKHNIKYYLGQGTLLGAAKYKKFIPWDDDIDLLLPYKDLKKLIKVFPKEADKKYIITNCFIEKHFPVSWSKIRNTQTLTRPYRYKDLPINWGICIDLFPIYSVSNIALFRKFEYLLYRIASKLIMAEFTKFEEGHGFVVRLIEKIPNFMRRGFLKFVIGILNMHKDTTKYVLVSCKEAKILERGILFGEEKYLDFEDSKFPAISEYEKYLTLTYGNWRADLPEDQKRGHDLILGDIEWQL